MDECYKYYNSNPAGARVGDCTVRALCKATGKGWDEVYCGLCAYGHHRKDMPSANAVWGAYLRDQGFTRSFVGDGSGRYTVEDFARDHPEGVYVLALDGHVVCVKDGLYHDAWDSGQEVPIYCWEKG